MLCCQEYFLEDTSLSAQRVVFLSPTLAKATHQHAMHVFQEAGIITATTLLFLIFPLSERPVMKSDQQTRVPVTPGAMETLRVPADVHLSPDGQRIAYVVLEPVSDQPKRQGRIWVVDTSGGEPQPLTKGPGDDSCPHWSPDNQQLAFISKSKAEGTKGKAQLFLIPANGSEATQVCATPNEVSDLEWSPDGKRIAFL
jgi:WD40 repeat protein